VCGRIWHSLSAELCASVVCTDCNACRAKQSIFQLLERQTIKTYTCILGKSFWARWKFFEFSSSYSSRYHLATRLPLGQAAWSSAEGTYLLTTRIFE
jgi:hypothetical protein